MQNAKDTFYWALRGRIAALNAARTVVVRGQVRPGVMVVENELSGVQLPSDAFVLEWTTLKVDTQEPLPLVAMQCAIRYATDGSAGASGMDRGRALARMDAELFSAMAPRHAVKMNYAVTPAVAMTTNVFWSDAEFAPVKTVGERLERVAAVTVYAYQEAGEK